MLLIILSSKPIGLPAFTPTSRPNSMLDLVTTNQEIEKNIPQMSKLFCPAKPNRISSSWLKNSHVDIVSVNLLENKEKSMSIWYDNSDSEWNKINNIQANLEQNQVLESSQASPILIIGGSDLLDCSISSEGRSNHANYSKTLFSLSWAESTTN